MIHSLRGTLLLSEPGFVVIECGGVGFKCMISSTTQYSMPPVGQEVFLYTHLNVTQDAFSLYGFSSREENSCFRMLTNVSGIGSKTAMAVLSALTPEQIAVSVASGDYKALTKANGIGPKQAQRIVLELKDKFKSVDVGSSSGSAGVPAAPAGGVSEAISALMVLGCSAAEASALVAKTDVTQPVEKIISDALRLMAK
ncbi:MAG: Holliday junction branch migration protein RuvA [Clostridia bacterium]|nr:Holliday junction branch migration protein RuvA [Oscillospiraceae bacterium]MBQ6797218.1 Holliday junction branch migration protein RuvA [Clostridia bacterium]